VADYRITESGGATEGAPAAGAAEIVVDITTTGATLAANGLKVLTDGLILKSQAQLAASLKATWSKARLAAAEQLLRTAEARASALDSATLTWPAKGSSGEARVVASLKASGATVRPHGLLIAAEQAAGAAQALTAAGLGPVTVAQPDFVFDVDCKAIAELKDHVL
jgi:ATP phosphoribosyltransferase